jgi:steroid 5-alpha reductase family enzyme
MSSDGFFLDIAVTAVVVLVCMLALWRVALRINDVSIVDIFWGLGFVIISAITLALGDAPIARRLLVGGLASVWGLRLGGYLYWRNQKQGEDPRYTALRGHIPPERFARHVLVNVFLFQGLVMWLVSMPVQVGGNLTDGDVFGQPQVWLGILVWAIGLTFEAVGDAQLARFKADPANAGQVMDRGLWRYTRHPNYFGDACVWWGIWLTVAINADGLWAVLAPIGMTYALLRVTGKKVLEARLHKTRPGYAEYVARTSGFIPLPPKRDVRLEPERSAT